MRRNHTWEVTLEFLMSDRLKKGWGWGREGHHRCHRCHPTHRALSNRRQGGGEGQRFGDHHEIRVRVQRGKCEVQRGPPKPHPPFASRTGSKKATTVYTYSPEKERERGREREISRKKEKRKEKKSRFGHTYGFRRSYTSVVGDQRNAPSRTLSGSPFT